MIRNAIERKRKFRNGSVGIRCRGSKKYLIENKKLLSKEKIDRLETEIKEEIQAAVERAEEQKSKLKEPLEMFDHVYAELPKNLKEQKAQLAGELSGNKKEDGHD